MLYRAARHKDKKQDLDELVSNLDFLCFLMRMGRDINIVTEKQFSLFIEVSRPCVKQASDWLKSTK